MDKELIQGYDNQDYPVAVNFIERKKDEGTKGEWVVRPREIEFLVVNNGELKISCSDKTHRAFPGQGVLINMNVRHRITSSAKENTTYYSVVFAPAFALDAEPESPMYDKYLDPITGDKAFTCFVLDEANLWDESVLDKINDIIVANTIKKTGYELLTKSYICMLWVLLLDYLMTKKTAFNGRNAPSQDEIRVRSAIQYMSENYADLITLEDLADKIHVSRNECCRCFKRVMQVSPVDFLIKLRIFEAAKLLYKAPLKVESISELALQTGFNNISYFNRAFKKHMECTPTQFQKMLKTDPEEAKALFDNLQEAVTGL